ncbi:MAG TPA: type II toxin-antitoxin system Phd/YefM family antitoxin [Candidatus Saccharimonadales bacterium]|nr:type II toxin-antitoxin system Phd/YefM family antitoxin [Candidatus Saccharimonadales bacterium]
MRLGVNTQRKIARSRVESSGTHWAKVSREHSYTATEAKNEFGRLLDEAVQGATVVITKHDAPRAVLISMEQFRALQNAPQLKLETLSSEFDALLARMQGAKIRAAMERAFNAFPEELGKTAVAAVRHRG